MCCVLLGIKSVMGVAAITIVLTNYFTHPGWLFWHSSSHHTVRGCDQLEVVPVWQVKFPKLLTEGSTRMIKATIPCLPSFFLDLYWFYYYYC